MKNIREFFPNHKLDNNIDFEVKQFTAKDLVEFSDYNVKQAIKICVQEISKKIIEGNLNK